MSDYKSLESLFQLVHVLKREMHHCAEEIGFDITPMHIRVLKIIDRKKGCTAIDIANFLERDKAQVTRLLNALLKQNLIVKVPNPEDKRSQCLRIGTEGEVIISKIKDIDSHIFQKITANLSHEDLSEFERISGLMRNNLLSKS